MSRSMSCSDSNQGTVLSLRKWFGNKAPLTVAGGDVAVITEIDEALEALKEGVRGHGGRGI